MPRGSANFQSYVNNLHRIYMVELIDRLTHDLDRKENFRASLVGNPVRR